MYINIFAALGYGIERYWRYLLNLKIKKNKKLNIFYKKTSWKILMDNVNRKYISIFFTDKYYFLFHFDFKTLEK